MKEAGYGWSFFIPRIRLHRTCCRCFANADGDWRQLFGNGISCDFAVNQPLFCGLGYIRRWRDVSHIHVSDSFTGNVKEVCSRDESPICLPVSCEFVCRLLWPLCDSSFKIGFLMRGVLVSIVTRSLAEEDTR